MLQEHQIAIHLSGKHREMQPWTRLPSQARTSLLLGSLGFGHSCPAAHPASSHPDQGLSAQTCKAQGSLYWGLLSPVLGTCLPPALVHGRLCFFSCSAATFFSLLSSQENKTHQTEPEQINSTAPKGNNKVLPPPWSLPAFLLPLPPSFLPSAPPRRHPDSLLKQSSWQAPHWLTANVNAKCPKIETNITLYNTAKNPLKKRSSLHGVTSICVLASRVWKNRATETFKADLSATIGHHNPQALPGSVDGLLVTKESSRKHPFGFHCLTGYAVFIHTANFELH